MSHFRKFRKTKPPTSKIANNGPAFVIVLKYDVTAESKKNKALDIEDSKFKQDLSVTVNVKALLVRKKERVKKEKKKKTVRNYSTDTPTRMAPRA